MANIRTADVIFKSWQMQNVNDAIDELIIVILLPLLLLPVVYIFAVIMSYEIIFLASKNINNAEKMRWPMRLACLIKVNIQLGPLNNLGGIWLQKLNEARGFREALDVLKTLKRAYHKKKYQEKARKKRLRKMKGKQGVDQDGLQLDRREFYESKHDLESLLYAQMTQFRNGRKGYNPDLPIQLGFSKLPVEHDITMKVRKDKKAWYAWRQMTNGYHFGVGGSSNIDDVWLYDSMEKPTSFPASSAPGWHNKNLDDLSLEWSYEDAPPLISIPENYFE